MKDIKVKMIGSTGTYIHCHLALALLYRLKSGMFTLRVAKLPMTEVQLESHAYEYADPLRVDLKDESNKAPPVPPVDR